MRPFDEQHWSAYPDANEQRTGLLIPRWMFDEAVCARMAVSAHPQVYLTTLRALRGLLDATAAGEPVDPIVLRAHASAPDSVEPDPSRESGRRTRRKKHQ